jgi:hypothetical protein
MMRIKSIVFLVALILGSVQSSLAAQHLLDKDERTGEIWCLFSGSIANSEVIPFQRNLGLGCRTLYLASGGGEIEAAMAMGRALRKSEVTVVVLEKGRCASACVLLYAAGVMRANYGPVEIHRPYMADGRPESFAASQARYKSLESRVRAYLREMNVSETLYERMMLIPPERAEKLTLEDMDRLGMGGSDPVYAETLENRKAARLGLSKQDFLRAKARASAVCGSLDGVHQEASLPSLMQCWKREFPGYVQ